MGRYIPGPEVGELEELLADYVGVRHCIGVSSGAGCPADGHDGPRDRSRA